MDTPLDIPGLAASDTAPVPTGPRTPARGHLPDGTPLHLTAGIAVDMAAIFHDEFTAYFPQRADEFAILLWMASRDKSAWRTVPPGRTQPLLTDFPALRAEVMDWIDTAFLPSESDLIRSIAIDLWFSQVATRVVLSEKKNPPAAPIADPPSTTPTPSPKSSTQSLAAIF